MTYEEALNVINSRLRFGVKPGLERVSALLERLGEPQKKLKFVHVAGTNGKGTCSTLISSVLRESGLKTGLYTSPYALDFRERFQIDGEMISHDELIREVELLAPAAAAVEEAGETVTEFEFITALAFHRFAEKECDIVVLEVGLGGRFDATNVIDVPEAAVIMSISPDHTAILGDTVEQIAFEKAGIIQPGGDIVLYPEQTVGVKNVIADICTQRGASLYIPDMGAAADEIGSLHGTEFTVPEGRLRTPFLGEHQVKNALTALEAIRVLRAKGFDIPWEAVRRGFEKAAIPARMEVLSEKPLCLLDGGHNPGCAMALKDALERFVPGKKTAIIGMMADKDVEEYLRLTAPLFDRIITVAPENPRSLPAAELAEKAERFCPEVIPAESMEEGAAAALNGLAPGESLIVCGSFYMASEIRPVLMEKLR